MPLRHQGDQTESIDSEEMPRHMPMGVMVKDTRERLQPEFTGWSGC